MTNIKNNKQNFENIFEIKFILYKQTYFDEVC